MIESPGFFEVARVPRDISTEIFLRDYFEPEQPVIIEGAALDWPALSKWDRAYLQERFAGEPSVKHVGLFLTMGSDVIAEDVIYPPFVENINHPSQIFPYSSNTRVWMNTRGNVSAWHFDNGLVNNFNTQIVGRKEWTLISPQTPCDCYPFTNFVVMQDEEKLLQNKVFTRFITEPGDMLYLPPLWFHTVRALSHDNINVMWVFTKRKTKVSSPVLSRDIYRYRMHLYFSRHRFAAVRGLYQKARTAMPNFARTVWHFDDLTETGDLYTRRGAAAWLLRELAMMGKTLGTARRIHRSIQSAEKAPRFGGYR